MKTKTSYSSGTGLRFGTTVMAALASVMLFCSSARAADRQKLRGHVPTAVAKLGLQPEGRLPGTNQLRLAIGFAAPQFQRLRPSDAGHV
jgi:hypothetical protein